MECLKQGREMYSSNLKHQQMADKMTKEREKDSLFDYYHEDNTPYYEWMLQYQGADNETV
jgi:hypothetical protein